MAKWPLPRFAQAEEHMHVQLEYKRLSRPADEDDPNSLGPDRIPWGGPKGT